MARLIELGVNTAGNSSFFKRMVMEHAQYKFFRLRSMVVVPHQMPVNLSTEVSGSLNLNQ